jgi:hypothetical protein
VSVTEIALTADGALALHVDTVVLPMAAAWIPRYRQPVGDGSTSAGEQRARAVIHVVTANVGDLNKVWDAQTPTLTLANVQAVVGGNRVRLYGPSRIFGDVDLAANRARIAAKDDASVYELQGALTLASALLLSRIGRALIHAAAVVDPSNNGWLLVGDSHAGKTTTCATLISAGWRYVADDQVVLSCKDNGVVAEGWPREAHLDAGWHSQNIESRRVPADLTALRPDAWTSHATLRGVLFPIVVADHPTRVDRISAADALTRIVRQSPWLFADNACAASTLSLLTRLASLACASLTLGRDSYASGAVLDERIRLGSSA